MRKWKFRRLSDIYSMKKRFYYAWKKESIIYNSTIVVELKEWSCRWIGPGLMKKWVHTNFSFFFKQNNTQTNMKFVNHPVEDQNFCQRYELIHD